MTQPLRLLLIPVLLLFLAACGGGGGGDDGGGNEPDGPRPVAKVTADATEVSADGTDTVHLDGSESTSLSGAIRSWQWRVLSRPNSSAAAIENADQPQASFTPDVAGEYVIQLVVTDDVAKSEDTRDSRVTITATRDVPVAVLQDEISWILGTVQLDGSRSLPPEGGDANQLIYQWELINKPQDSTATLDSGSLVYPRFTADKIGDYRAQLVVKYGSKTSEPATVDIHIRKGNAEPVAKIEIIEPKGKIMRGDTVVLRSASKDADSDPLQYRWRFMIAPPGSTAELGSMTAAETSFVAGSSAGFGYQVELCVFDGIARSCSVKFIPSPQLPGNASNTPPVAVIGRYSTKHLTFEAEIGAEMRLNSESYDVDGDALTETWSFASYPAGFDPASDAKLGGWDANFTPTVAGGYKVKLTVSDGQVNDTAIQTFTALLGANHSPTAVAAVTAGATTTLVGQVITLDGEGSSDPDDNKLTFDWTLIQRPDGSNAQLQGSNPAHPALTPDVAGPYLVKLVVTDSHGVSSPYRPGSPQQELVIMAKSSNHRPVTRIMKQGWGGFYVQSPDWGIEQPFAIAGKTRMDNGVGVEVRDDYFTLKADTYDPDGDSLSHLWTLVKVPAGNQFQTSGDRPVGECDFSHGEQQETCQSIALAPTKPGLYVFQYQVYDGMDFAGPFTATVHAVLRQNYPTLLLEVQGQPAPQHVVYLQAVFPYDPFGMAGTHLSPKGPTPIGKTIRLTAFGGNYTLTDIQLNSDDPRFSPRFMDITNSREIINGYVIPQGESIEVQFQLVVPDTIPRDEQLKEDLTNANITGFFRIKEKPDWTVSMQAGKFY